MCLGGLDPTGGAGLQADIEATVSMGAHPLPVITAITVQDTVDVRRCEPVSAVDVIEQARAVVGDIDVAAFKLGLLGSVAVIEAVHSLLRDFPGIPVVFDPVCASGGGTPLVDEEQLDAMVSLLFPYTTVLTPNSHEARLLSPEADSLGASAQELMSYGCEHVLLTGTHEDSPVVVNKFYGAMHLLETYSWERLPGSYHGSGCTLAAAIAALLAHGFDAQAAVSEAQEYTWAALRAARQLGRGQFLPNRFHWTQRRTDA